jgi:hypothetical protein
MTRLPPPLLMLGFSVVVAVGIFLHATTHGISTEEWAQKHDPVLARLFELNPGMKFEDEATPHLPIYWMIDPTDGKRFLLPRSEAEEAVIRMGPCDPGSPPQAIAYPRTTTTACIEIRNARHTLRAIGFHIRDRHTPIVVFYDMLLPPERRASTAPHSGENYLERAERRDRTHALIFSYVLNETVETDAFVAYEEKTN